VSARFPVSIDGGNRPYKLIDIDQTDMYSTIKLIDIDTRPWPGPRYRHRWP